MAEDKKRHHQYDKPCGLIISHGAEKDKTTNWGQIKNDLDKGTIDDKKRCVKRVITALLNNEPVPPLLMPIIQNAMTKDDKELKKLLLIYWEIIEKTNSQGKLLPELVLVCNNLRNDLNHANEYVRGTTLRLMSKLREQELFEPLLPSIITNLDYKHAYVRRNAVLALYNVYKHFEHLCPDAPDRILKFLHTEADATCKRNGFIMLYNTAPDKAVLYMSEILDQVSSMGEIVQFIVVDLIRRICRTNPSAKGKYIRCVFQLLTSGTAAVRYEAAGVLISLSSAPSAIKAAASTFIELLVRESDNNVKLVCLERIESLKANYKRILQDLLLDLLRALQSPSLDIRKKTLDIALNLVTPKNIDGVIQVLKKEINKSQSKEMEKGPEYRQMLIQAIHTCATRFPDIAESVVYLLMDFLSDSSASSVDVILFVREVVELYPNLRNEIVKRLVDSLDQIKSIKVYRTSLWIVGEYSETSSDLDRAFFKIKKELGHLPLLEPEEEQEPEHPAENKPPTSNANNTNNNNNNNNNNSNNTNTAVAPKASKAEVDPKAKASTGGFKTEAYTTQSAVSMTSEVQETKKADTMPKLRSKNSPGRIP